LGFELFATELVEERVFFSPSGDAIDFSLLRLAPSFFFLFLPLDVLVAPDIVYSDLLFRD